MRGEEGGSICRGAKDERVRVSLPRGSPRSQNLFKADADVGAHSLVLTRRIFESRANRDEKCSFASNISARERRTWPRRCSPPGGLSPSPSPRDAASSRASRVRRARPRPRRRLRLRATSTRRFRRIAPSADQPSASSRSRKSAPCTCTWARATWGSSRCAGSRASSCATSLPLCKLHGYMLANFR